MDDKSTILAFYLRTDHKDLTPKLIANMRPEHAQQKPLQ
jgi:hypothetical protein